MATKEKKIKRRPGRPSKGKTSLSSRKRERARDVEITDPNDGRATRAKLVRTWRRKQVLEAALKVFAAKGYHDTSISDIVETADISRGTFYLYFDNKRAIFEEILDYFIQRIVSRVNRISLDEDAPSPLDQIRRNVAGVIDELSENAEFTKILLYQAVGLDVDFDQQLADFYDEMLQLIAGALRLGIEMKIVRPCQPEITAWCILGSIKEMASHYLTTKKRGRPKRKELVQEILNYTLKGVYAWEAQQN